MTKVKGARALATTSSEVDYALDANGSLTSDGLRTFDYDAAGRMSKVRVMKDGESATIGYLHNALGQRVFKGEPQAEQTLPSETALGQGFVDWLKKNFSWLYASAQANTSVGTAYVYGDEQIPGWALLGEYDNGSAVGAGRSEYIWLLGDDGDATPVGMYRNGKFFAIHADHLGTPRLMTNEANTPVWQWPYSAFGNNKPTGVLKATPNPKAAITNVPVLLQATAAPEMNLRMPGQYADVETGTFQNWNRSYWAMQGRYTQADPIGLAGGWNRFVYVEGNPLSLFDSEGFNPKPGRYAESMPFGPGAGGGALPLPRWTPKPGEFKPTYKANPAHDPKSPLYNPKKTPEPKDCPDVYKRAVPDDPIDPRHWWGKSADGNYYRFHNSNDGTAHFSGSFAPIDSSVPRYVRERLGPP